MTRLEPVTYSLILNLAILVIAGALAWAFAQPLIFALALLCLEHTIGLFERGTPEPQNADAVGGIGFLADIGDDD